LLRRATTSIFRFGSVYSGNGSKAHLTIYCNTPLIVSDSKGFFRVISSYKITPTAQTSALLSYGLPRHTSGGIKRGVPQLVPAFASRDSSSLDIPKSPNFKMPFLAIKMF